MAPAHTDRSWLWGAIPVLVGVALAATLLLPSSGGQLELPPSAAAVQTAIQLEQPPVEPPPLWLERPRTAPAAKKTRAGKRPPAPDPAPAPAEEAEEDPETLDEEQPPKQIVVLPGRVDGDDHVITVKPRAKMKPMFSAEEFKRRGMRGIFGGYRPVQPAPAGIESEAD